MFTNNVVYITGNNAQDFVERLDFDHKIYDFYRTERTEGETKGRTLCAGRNPLYESARPHYIRFIFKKIGIYPPYRVETPTRVPCPAVIDKKRLQIRVPTNKRTDAHQKNEKGANRAILRILCPENTPGFWLSGRPASMTGRRVVRKNSGFLVTRSAGSDHRAAGFPGKYSGILVVRPTRFDGGLAGLSGKTPDFWLSGLPVPIAGPPSSPENTPGF